MTICISAAKHTHEYEVLANGNKYCCYRYSTAGSALFGILISISVKINIHIIRIQIKWRINQLSCNKYKSDSFLTT